jgi:hypothetical protein
MKNTKQGTTMKITTGHNLSVYVPTLFINSRSSVFAFAGWRYSYIKAAAETITEKRARVHR